MADLVEETAFASFVEKQSVEPSSDTNAGTGGDVLSSWGSRSDIINNLLVGSYTNNSSFSIPSTLTENTQFASFTNKRNGFIVEADFRDSDSTPLAGTVSSLSDGGVVNEKQTSGFVAINAELPDGIESGSNTDSSAGREITFEPDGQGLDFSQNVTSPGSIGQVKYGEISGSVLDYNGDPASNDRVSIGDNGFFTDSNGDYSVKGPGGQSFNVESLRASKSLSLQFNGGSVTTQDFQYGGIDVSVSLPDNDGIQGVTVSTSSTVGKKQTDSNGSVRFVEAEVGGTVSVNIGDFTVSVTGPSQGGLATATKQVGFGVKGILQDAGGNGVSGVDILADVENQLRAVVDNNGNFKVGADDSGTVTIVISENDRRYQKEEFEVDVQQGDVIDNLVVEMEPKENIGTAI